MVALTSPIAINDRSVARSSAEISSWVGRAAEHGIAPATARRRVGADADADPRQ
jgi:hypothetical protein